MSAAWQLQGSETASVGSMAIDLPSRPRTVLLRLLIDANRTVSWEKLAEFVWGDHPPKTQRNSIARFIADLRRALGPLGDRVTTDAGGYRLVVLGGELDLHVAADALDRAKALADSDPELAHEHILVAMTAVGSGTNEWLVGLAAAAPEIHRQQELQIAVLETLADLKFATGRHVELVAVLEQAVREHPFHEQLWTSLITALALSGRSVDALRACRRLRSTLAEIGLDPTDDVVRLEAQLVSGSTPARRRRPRPGPAPIRGRAADITAICSALAHHRVVTVVGPVAAGKSLLISEVIRVEEASDVAVYHVDLRPFHTVAQVNRAVAVAIGVPASRPIGAAAELAQFLAPLGCLLVVDNAEHVRVACAQLIDEIVAVAPGVRVVVGSRVAVGYADEHVCRIGLLPTDTTTTPSPAVAWFDENATVALTGRQSTRDVEEMCVAVGGHPFAIELLARCTDDVTTGDLVAGLAQLAPRTSTAAVDAALELAWKALGPPEQALLARMSVFAGGSTAGGVECVCNENSSGDAALATLLHRRLIQQNDDGRYSLREAVRLFASDRLADRRETRVIMDRLAEWLLRLTSDWTIAELGAYAGPGIVLSPERDNILEALHHLERSGRREEMVWLAVRCGGLWINHGMCDEVGRWLGSVVDDDSVSDAGRSAAAMLMGEADLALGNFGTLVGLNERALELANGEPLDWIPAVTGFLSLLAMLMPIGRSTDEYLDDTESIALRTPSRELNRAHAFYRRAHAAHHRRQYDLAVDHFGCARRLVLVEGRLLLGIEMGETMSLFLAERHGEALDSVDAWKSTAETDEWHYQVEIVKAIVVGGCGDPADATAELAEALRRQHPVALWARGDEFQTAFGLLAGMRGETDLSAELLSTARSGSPFLTSIVIEYALATRGLDGSHYAEVAKELRSSAAPGAHKRSTMRGRDLVEWWRSGTTASTVEDGWPTPRALA